MPTQTKPPMTRGRAIKWAILTAVAVAVLPSLYPLARYAWASSHYHSALRAAERREFDTARRHFDVCLRQWPDSGEVHFQAARAARRGGDFDEARRLLKEAERLGWVREAIELEKVLLSAQQGDYRPYSAPLRDFLRRGHPDSVLIAEVLAPRALDNFELVLADECLDAWTRLEPQNPRPFVLKGDVQERLRHVRAAADLYRRAVDLAPDDFDARLRLGRTLLDLNEGGEARAHFERLGHVHPDDAEVRRGMARCLYQLGEGDRARPILDALLKESPGDGQALLVRGQLELNGGQGPAAAEPFLRRAAELMPYEVEVMHNFATCLHSLGKDREAEEVRKRSEQAKKDIEEVQKLIQQVAARPGDAEPRYQIAVRYMRNGLEEEGRRWLESGLRLNPLHLGSHEKLADYYTRLGDTHRAGEHRAIIQQLKEQTKAGPRQ